MITWNDSANRTITGYHDKGKGKTITFDGKYPVDLDRTYIPFLLTRDSYFEFNPLNTNKFFETKTSEKYLKSIKTKLANILIIPGLLIAFAYLLKYVGIFSQIVLLETFLDSPLINTFFWIAFLGVIILWHDYYSHKVIFSRLPKTVLIPESEIEDLSHNGIKFERFAHVNPLKFISSEFLESIDYESKEFSTLELFKSLLQNDDVEDLLKRSYLEIKGDRLKELEINKTGLPKLPKVAYNLLLLYSLEEALLTNSPNIQPLHLFLALIKSQPILSKLIIKLGSSLNVLREVTGYLLLQKRLENPYGYLNPSAPYYRTGGIAKNWIYGYTFILSQFSRDVNEEVARVSDTFGIGHQTEIENLVSVLGRASKKHVLLIGEPGVGKSSLIKGLAQRINRGEVPPMLSGVRIVQMDINGLIAHSSGKKNMEFYVQKAMTELAKAGNVILYIDELQELIPAKAQETGHSIADILLPYVTEGRFAVVGTVNYADYKKYFYTNESFRQSFSNIEVAELPAKDTLRILQSKIPALEKTFAIYITFPALISAVELAQRYIHTKMMPDSASTLLEDACSWAKLNGINVLTPDHLAKMISLQTNMSVGAISTDEAEKLISLEDRIKQRVIGQDEAVHVVSEALRRARADIRDPKRPIGAFLFIGPTGVGKTYLAKTISQEYFNNEEDIVRVDMSEYMDEQSVSKLLGSYGQKNADQTQLTLLDKIKANPYTVVLFDEVEKADSKILDLFLQLFEEGRLTSTNGETIDFTNTIIICTSNIAADLMLKSLEEGQMWEETKNLVTMELKQAIRPELFNRFDGIVMFHPQSIENLSKISDMQLDELYKRLHEKNVELDWEATIPMMIANKAYEPGFGARPIRRYVQEKIEGKIAQEMIAGTIKAGDSIKINESWIV